MPIGIQIKYNINIYKEVTTWGTLFKKKVALQTLPQCFDNPRNMSGQKFVILLQLLIHLSFSLLRQVVPLLSASSDASLYFFWMYTNSIGNCSIFRLKLSVASTQSVRSNSEESKKVNDLLALLWATLALYKILNGRFCESKSPFDIWQPLLVTFMIKHIFQVN